MTGRESSRQVTDFVWRDSAVTAPFGSADIAMTDPAINALNGQFALHLQSKTRHLLVRDPLGVNKLFFAIGPGGQVDVSNYLIDHVRAGRSLHEVWSVPSGHALRFDTASRDYRLTRYTGLAFNEAAAPADDPYQCAAAIRSSLEATIRQIRPLAEGRSLYVTMSGGLDSTTVSVLTREIIGEFTGVTFTMADSNGQVIESEDLRYVRRLAKDINVRLKVVSRTAKQLLELLDPVLVYGQDWRDFNVHCGLVNAAIGFDLARDLGTQSRPLLLTGDCANELTADYTPVSYRGQTYYTLPDLPAGRLRRFLVTGLDTGDREIGIYAHFGCDVLEPYALCAPAFTQVPATLLEVPQAKQKLMERAVAGLVPAYILARPKVRAQSGSHDNSGGTLAAVADAGVGSQELSARFCELFQTDARALRGLIKAGMYRFSTQYPGN
ncbi:MAG: asparagine synthase-related protein [Gammaproteobacteria bacterium]|nr:asparagine synthase-related protein [Gammaproteobacteria bacterium]